MIISCSGRKKAIRKKIVFVGGPASGKETLLRSATRGTDPYDVEYSYHPVICENAVVDVFERGKWMEMALWNTSNYDDSFEDRLRPLAYINADAAVVTFAVDDPETFQRVFTKWVPDLRSFFEPRMIRIPILLVGCKADRRTDSRYRRSCFVPEGDAERMVSEFGLSGYIECSAKDATRTGVFQTLARLLQTG